MIKRSAALLIFFSVPALLMGSCDGQNQSSSSQITRSTEASTDPDPILGKLVYVSKCAICHGKDGTGSHQGPPLVHKIYEPGHHADYSFYKAVAFGVQSHHWRFGNMPAIPGISPESVANIIAYIRQEQRLAGIR